MKNKHLIILINDFSEKLLGVQISAIQRASLLSSYGRANVTILTTKFNRYFWRNSKKHLEIHAKNINLEVTNLYFDILGITEEGIRKNKSLYIKSKDYDHSHRITSTHERYYDKNGNCKMYVVYLACKEALEVRNIDYINYFYKKKKIKKDLFLCNGSLILSQYLNDEYRVIKEEYFDECGVPRIVKNYDNGKIIEIYLNSSAGQLLEVFSSEDELITWWLENRFVKAPTIFMIDGGPHHIVPIKKIETAKIISILHSNHIKLGEAVLSGKFNSAERERLLRDPNSVQACVILTNEQQKDIESRFTTHCPLFTIPHALTKIPEKMDFQYRDLDRIIIISRLEKEKNIFEAIDIFEKVVECFANKKLYIYGDGSDKAELENYVIQKNLTENIFFMGHTTDVTKELNRSVLFLMTSLYEAFSLTILESLSHGVPVLSYDFKYGPKSMIKNGVNGFLIPNLDRDLAVKMIIEFFQSEDKMRTMSNSAYKSINKFKPERIVKKWNNLFKVI